MRLGVQLVAVMAAIVILPIAALFAYVKAIDGRGVPIEPLIRYARIKREVSAIAKPGPDGSLERVEGRSAPSWLGLAVFGLDGQTVFSNLDAGADTAFGSGDRIRLAETLFSKGRIVGSYIAEIDAPPSVRSQPVWLTTVSVWYAFIVAATSVGVGVVIGRLASSVRRLEGAAAGIAAGDLETRIVVNGPREIRSLAEAMERMRLALKDEEDRRVRFIASVSHDLKTPLTAIEGYIEAIEDSSGDPGAARRYLSVMSAKAQTLESRIHDLLDFAKASTGDWRARLALRPLAEFLSGAAKSFAEDAVALGFSFFADIRVDDSISVPMDESLAFRALENIVGNAFRYCPRGSTIRLEARPEGSDVAIAIHDNGPGIAASELGLIFEPYYRGSKSRREEGSGLGLFIAASIASSHGWGLKAESTEGEGTSFVIRVPIRVSAA